MAEPTRPKIAIVYIDDSLVQRDRVQSLSERLRREGFEARLDAWEPAAEPQKIGSDPFREFTWSVDAKWSEREGSEAHVLLVLSDSWIRRSQEGDPHRLLLDWLRTSDSSICWPVALSGTDARSCPTDVKYLDLSREDGYRILFRALSPSSGNGWELSAAREAPLLDSGQSTVWHVPFRRDLGLTDREDLLERLRTELTPGQYSRPVVLAGPAGVGKSRVALEYAYRHRSTHPSIVWLEATSQLKLDRGLREIATRLGQAGVEAKSSADLVEFIADWLRDNPSSLLVIDGADRPASIPERFLRSPPCQILMTSRIRRRSSWGPDVLVLEVAARPAGSQLGDWWWRFRGHRRAEPAIEIASLETRSAERFLFAYLEDGSIELGDHHARGARAVEVRSSAAGFVANLSWGGELLARLQEDGAGLLGIRPFGQDCWLLRLRLPEALQETHGTAPDLLLLAARGEVRGADLQRAQEELYQRDLDLDPDLLLIADGMPHLAERLERMFVIRGQWIPWSQAGDRFPPLTGALRRYLPTYDIFEARDPVRGRQVVGRHELVSDLSRRLLQGQAVGVFGLRKVGKTTLVRAVTDRLDPASAHYFRLGRFAAAPEMAMARVIWLDLERIYERTLETVSEHLLQELERRLDSGRLGGKSHPLSTGPFARLEALLAATLRHSDVPLVIVLDEYDLLFEGVAGQPAIPNIHRLFQLLRGYAQQSGRLALITIGRDPESLQQPQMGGWPNPVLNWIIPRWLGPLEGAAATELLTNLGRRVLLDIGHETAELAGRWTGGHPLLQRQFGSSLLALAGRQRQEDRVLATDPICQQGVAEFLKRDAVLGLCREVDHLLASRYPQAAELLGTLCQSPVESACTFLQHGGCGSAQQVLRNFGLLLGEAELARVPEVYRWYFRNFAPQAERLRA